MRRQGDAPIDRTSPRSHVLLSDHVRTSRRPRTDTDDTPACCADRRGQRWPSSGFDRHRVSGRTRVVSVIPDARRCSRVSRALTARLDHLQLTAWSSGRSPCSSPPRSSGAINALAGVVRWYVSELLWLGIDPSSPTHQHGRLWRDHGGADRSPKRARVSRWICGSACRRCSGGDRSRTVAPHALRDVCGNRSFPDPVRTGLFAPRGYWHVGFAAHGTKDRDVGARSDGWYRWEHGRRRKPGPVAVVAGSSSRSRSTAATSVPASAS